MLTENQLHYFEVENGASAPSRDMDPIGFSDAASGTETLTEVLTEDTFNSAVVKPMVDLSWELGTRAKNDVEIERFVESNTARNAEDFFYTYKNGIQQPEKDPTAPQVTINIYFIAGCDTAYVNKAENDFINRAKPPQKSPEWRVLTSGKLLVEREADAEDSLAYLSRDLSPTILANYRANKRQGAAARMTDLASLGKKANEDCNVLNIDSRNVRLVNAIWEQDDADFTCTCIEVDGTSIMKLIQNFKILIQNTGRHANRPLEETWGYLEQIYEDARRLLVRSPILSRVSQRIFIQKSQNTRYGVNTGKCFEGLITSRGIAEVIKLGVSYYSDLQKNKDSQMRIRPKLMQLVVLLLALVNDTDLASIRESLEQSYGIQADRQSVELTILKVLTSYSVAPQLFLSGVLSAFSSVRVEADKTNEGQSAQWDEFLSEIASKGWIVPGSAPHVGRKFIQPKGQTSWKVQWQSYESTDIFNNLQYCGEKNTVNSIPPLRVNGTWDDVEVSADFQNGQAFKLKADVLDKATLGVRGRYPITHTETGEQGDLLIKEDELFPELQTACHVIQNVCRAVNNQFERAESGITKKSLGSVLGGLIRGSQLTQRFAVPPPVGPRSRCTTSIVIGEDREQTRISVSWKYNGRKVAYQGLLAGVSNDIQSLSSTVNDMKGLADKKRGADEGRKEFSALLSNLFQQLEVAQKNLDRAEENRVRMQGERPYPVDEPIIRAHFPNLVHFMQDLPWSHYLQTCSPDDWVPKFEVAKAKVAAPPKWTGDVARVELGDKSTIATVTPLIPITEELRKVQIHERDTVILLGGLIAVIKKRKGAPSDNFRVVNYMKLSSLDRKNFFAGRRVDSDDESDEDEEAYCADPLERCKIQLE